MPQSLRCPTCSAPLDVPDAHASTVKCPYCGAGALLTERLGSLQASPAQERHADAIADVLRQLRAGSKIGAIRVYRERFGVGLAEATEAVERIEAGQPAGSVPASAAGSPKAALVAAALVMAAAGGVGVLAMRSTPEDAAAPATQIAPGAPSQPAAKDAPPPAFAEPVLRFGSEGTGAGRFEDARSVAVDGAGRIYVAEYSGGRVQVFDSAGTFLTQWMADPRMPLLDLAADRAGTVYVVQSGRIRRHEGATGRALGEVRRRPGASFDDVALALDGTLWTVSGMHQVTHLGADGRVVRTIDTREAIDENAAPVRVAVAGTGDVYVLDRWKGEIYHLGPDGRFVDRFGGRSRTPGGEGMSAPEDLAIDGRGRVYVSDAMGGIHVFDADGRFLEEFGERLNAFGITFNDRDELFATNRNDAEIVKFRLTR
jgi:sugar lactone lactonase YvrE/ribosomal protein L7/L12